ncbi:hypothetical protein P7C70_g1930, partial [Phenoliferia sp. Uapishka_3]
MQSPTPRQSSTAHPFAACALSTSRSTSPDRLTLTGDTPIHTAPPSISGDTEFGSRPPSPELKKGNCTVDEDVEKGEAPPLAKEFPEGGARAYCAVLGGTLVLFSTFALSNSFGVFLQQYEKNQLVGYPSSTITWIGSVQLFLVFGTSLLSGMGFDRGFFRYQLAFGSLLWIFGMFMLSLSKTFVQIFLSQSICLGLGLGIMFGPVLSCVGTYFYRRRALMIGICASGGALGAIVFPILLNNFFVSHGFSATVRIAAYIMTALLLAANAIMRPRDLPAKQRAPIGPLLKKVFREPSMWVTCLGVFGGVMGLFVVMFYTQIFIKTHAANKTLSTYSLSILNAAAFFGRISVGLVADRIGSFSTIVPFAFVMGVSIFALLGATTTGGVLAFLLIFGFASGAFISIMASCFMALAEDVTEIGVRSGVGFFFVAVASLIGSPLAGVILKSAKGEYLDPCIFAGGSALAGVVALGFARRTQVIRRGTNYV